MEFLSQIKQKIYHPQIDILTLNILLIELRLIDKTRRRRYGDLLLDTNIESQTY